MTTTAKERALNAAARDASRRTATEPAPVASVVAETLNAMTGGKIDLDAPAAGDVDTAAPERFDSGLALTESGRIAPDPTRADERAPEFPEEPAAYIFRPYVPKKHERSSFDNFETTAKKDGRTVVDESLEVAQKAARRWLTAALEGRPAMLAIVGEPGNGKSHLLYACANALAEKERAVFCQPWYLLADAIRYGGPWPWKPKGAAVDGSVLRSRLLSSRIVLIDEVSATAGSEFDTNELRKLAGAAYDEGAAVLITSNVYPLEKIMGPAAADRFVPVVVTAPSRRQDF